MTEPTELSAGEISALLSSGETSSVEVTRAFLERIDRFNPVIGAFLHIDPEGALRAADGSDRRRAAGLARSPLDGVPLGLKDLIATSFMPTTCASRILEGYIPPYDAAVTERLIDAGCVVLGKQNMDEFAFGSSNENSGFMPVRNPHDISRVPGGSSGGSAAAVAARFVPFSLGSDTGGSIRQPASFCGVVGFKPTYGRVSRYGLIAFASSLDQIGPLTRSTADAALVFSTIGGFDPRDSTSAPVEMPDLSRLSGDLPRGMRIGLVEECMGEGASGEVRAALTKAAKKLEESGAEIVRVSLPHTDHVVGIYYIIATAEASSNLARFDGVRFGRRSESGNLIEMYRRTRSEHFGIEVKRRILLGTYVLSAGYYDAYYKKALMVRTLVRRDFDEAFGKADLLLTPTAPRTAFRLGEVTDPIEMYLSDIYTISANLAGLPAVSVPWNPSKDGLPIGIQLTAPPFEEARLLRAAARIEEIRGDLPAPDEARWEVKA